MSYRQFRDDQGESWEAWEVHPAAVERRLTRPAGLVTRPWFRSLQFAADVDNGYATMAFPTVNEAIRYADAATANRELADLVTRVDQARTALVEAAAALR